jgi:hypothetical protein
MEDGKVEFLSLRELRHFGSITDNLIALLRNIQAIS